MRVERSIDIDAPPERVYEILMDPRRLADWVTIHERLESAPPGELREGSELEQCLKLAGTRLHVAWTVVEDDPPRRVRWEGRGPVKSRAQVVYELRPRNGGGTRFSYTNEYTLPGGPLGRLGGRAVGPISARESERSLAKLKRLLES